MGSFLLPVTLSRLPPLVKLPYSSGELSRTIPTLSPMREIWLPAACPFSVAFTAVTESKFAVGIGDFFNSAAREEVIDLGTEMAAVVVALASLIDAWEEMNEPGALLSCRTSCFEVESNRVATLSAEVTLPRDSRDLTFWGDMSISKVEEGAGERAGDARGVLREIEGEGVSARLGVEESTGDSCTANAAREEVSESTLE